MFRPIVIIVCCCCCCAVLVSCSLVGSKTTCAFLHANTKRTKFDVVNFHDTSHTRSTSTWLSASSSLDEHNAPKKHATAAQQERRLQEKRKLQRKDDVVIGKTSALPNAQDYPIHPETTQEMYLQQASQVERQVHLETERGMDALKMFSLKEANDAFDKVFEIKPNAYLWQAGIVKYYLNDLDAAQSILQRCATFYQERFQQVASEELIWRDACRIKLRNQGGDLVKEESMLVENHNVMPETRKVHKIALELFSSTLQGDFSTMAQARAKLHMIGSKFSARQMDAKLWKLSAWFFLGLHFDALDQNDESKRCIKAAIVSGGNGQDVIHTLPALHMTCRDWYDDEVVLDSNDKEQFAQHDMLEMVKEVLWRSVQELKHVQLTQVLGERGVKRHGPKQELQERLFQSLLEEFQSEELL